jgi:hypothetical protein
MRHPSGGQDRATADWRLKGSSPPCPGSQAEDTLDPPTFCTECNAEYRADYTRCSDCDVDLVEALSPSDNSAKNELIDGSLGAIKRVWSGKDEERCVTLCERLKAARIPFKVDQRRRQYLLRVDEHCVIGVPTEFFDNARKMIIKGRLDATDGAEDKC